MPVDWMKWPPWFGDRTNVTSERYLQARMFVGVIILFMTSAYFSWQEAKYAFWGRTADANIISVRKVMATERRRRSREVYSVRYCWTADDGMKREDKMNRELDWQQPADGIIKIDYLPVVKGSRAHGERQTWALWVCGGLLAVVVIWSIKIFYEAYGPVRRPKRGDHSR